MWKFIVVLNCVVLFVVSQFENQYLGHSFTLDEYNNLELACDTKICLRDAQRLLLAATVDFKEFSMGQFIKLGALDDRKQFIGFTNDFYNRIRKVLAAKFHYIFKRVKIIINATLTMFHISRPLFEHLYDDLLCEKT